MAEVRNGNMSVYRASIIYNLPRKTLERRLKLNNDQKGPMGPSSTFGIANEKRLCKHIKEMQAKGFPLTMDDLRKIAFQFAEQLEIKHRFNESNEKAGYDWLQLFLKRNPDISLRKSEGVSYARGRGMNKDEVSAYFEMIEKTLTENDLLEKPGNIFNMDETGLQLNNKPGYVLAERGSKAVAMSTSTEKGETITVIACCNAEGNFLPPTCIMKGKRKKPEFEDGLPPGSLVFMSPKSSYITSDLFLEWMKSHFLPRKPAGKVLLLLDGHSTHCNSVKMLQFANDNDIIMLSMPSHTSHYLQPLDVAVFKSLKTYFYESCRLWMKQHPGRRLTRHQFGSLLNQAWGKSATSDNATSGFRATGVFPLNPGAIPDYAFGSNLEALGESQRENLERTQSAQLELGPSTSKTPISYYDKPTPTKVLNEISPLPNKIKEACKRAKQVSMLLTSEDYIAKQKIKEKEKEEKLKRPKKIKQEIETDRNKENKTVRKRKAIRRISDSSCEEVPMSLCDTSESENDDKEEDNCRGCGENYYKTQLVEDWLQCNICMLWTHENCTEFEDMCSVCGNKKKKELKGRKGKGKGKKSTGYHSPTPMAIIPGQTGRDGQS
ncbi:MFS-type transporter clz9-like [Maniola jurtina]|uniref:MFS-type transporter clz9-like n=1 Tax=Maniola jurtina TaxID=191418 RepID=UPI001E68A952|nr:MFS-type transporter clz9-like [Maniola jurtina]